MEILDVFFGNFWRWIGTLIILCILVNIPINIMGAVRRRIWKIIIEKIKGEKE